MLREKMVINDCYILQSMAGEDSYSEHWIATAIFSPTRCLLRFIKEGLAVDLESLRSESFRSYQIHGPQIADFIETEVCEGRFFISSEYHDERDLTDIELYRSGKSVGDICAEIEQIARALHSFHQHSVVYGNLTMEHIVAPRFSQGLGPLKIRKPSMLCLLPRLQSTQALEARVHAFLSPECKRGEALVPASDVYSLGVHLVRNLTGLLPFPPLSREMAKGAVPMDYLKKVLGDSRVPDGLAAIIVRCLAPSIGERYRSCTELLDDLEVYRLSTMRQAVSGSDTATNRPSRLPSQVLSTADISSIESLSYFRSLEEGGSPGARITTPVTPVPAPVPGKINEYWTAPPELVKPKTVLPSTGGAAPVPVPVPPVLDAVPTSPTSVPPVSKAIHGPSMTVPAGLSLSQMSPPDQAEGRERSWAHVRVRLEDVYEIIKRSAQRARRGKGSFRFVQEPDTGYAPSALFSLLSKLDGDYLYINAGSLARYGSADCRDFITLVRKALSTRLEEMSGPQRRALKRRMAAVDPLHRSLEESVRPDEDTELFSRALCAIGTKSRPLILVVRGGERINHLLHDILMDLARETEKTPVCVVVFFEHIRFESWHALARLQDR